MKTRSKIFLVLTVFGAILLPSCTTKKTGGTDALLKAYKTAREAQDYHAATAILVNLVAADSTQNTWAYDSLAYYHYFYLITPGVVRNTHTAKYYAQRGLELQPDNTYLTEIKARLELEDQKLAVAEATFRSLWTKTKDDTYWWILSFIEAHNKKNLNRADSMIDVAITNPDAEKKTVRIDLITERLHEKVPSKAAFLYLKATVLIVRGKLQEATAALQESLKIQPDFYSSKLAIYELEQSAKRRQQGQ
jgi:predicted Zn-dependent protease